MIAARPPLRTHRLLGFAFVWNAVLNWNHLEVGLDPDAVAEEEAADHS